MSDNRPATNSHSSCHALRLFDFTLQDLPKTPFHLLLFLGVLGPISNLFLTIFISSGLRRTVARGSQLRRCPGGHGPHADVAAKHEKRSCQAQQFVRGLRGRVPLIDLETEEARAWDAGLRRQTLKGKRGFSAFGLRLRIKGLGFRL